MFVVLLGSPLSVVQALNIRLFISFLHSLIQSHIHSFNNQNHFLDAFVVLGAVFSARKKR